MDLDPDDWTHLPDGNGFGATMLPGSGSCIYNFQMAETAAEADLGFIEYIHSEYEINGNAHGPCEYDHTNLGDGRGYGWFVFVESHTIFATHPDYGN